MSKRKLIWIGVAGVLLAGGIAAYFAMRSPSRVDVVQAHPREQGNVAIAGVREQS